MSVESTGSETAIEDPASLHRLLTENTDPATFAFAWLEIQCRQFPGVSGGVVLLRRSGTLVPIAKWPLTGRVAALAEAAQAVEEDGSGLVLDLADGHAAAFPIFHGSEINGVVALQLSGHDDRMLHAVMSQLQWSVAWFELFETVRQGGDQRADSARAQRALAVLSRVQAQTDFAAAAMLLVTELAGEFGCMRVSLGRPVGSGVRVEAVSHSARTDAGLKLTRALALAMNESMVLGGVQHFSAGETRMAPDHAAVIAQGGATHLLTLPVFIEDRYFWVLCFERDDGRPFLAEEQRAAQAICVLVAGALADKHYRSSPPPVRMFDAAKDGLGRLLRPGYLLAKLTASAAALLLAFLSLADGSYRVTADTLLEGEVQRVVAAPFGGYIEEALVKAGDSVAEGELLCQLDDSELRLERENWVSQRSQFRRQYDQAFASFERAEMNVAEARIEQATSQIALAERQLERSRMLAPFAGVVIEGDLSQRLGAYVEKGEVLFVIAPLAGYRVILFVDESQVSDVRKGQTGELVLTSQPDLPLPFIVGTITPVTEAADGHNRFRVEAELKVDQGTLAGLRPGMEGVAKILVDERRLLWIWTREFRHWLTLAWWRWWP